MKKLTLIRNAKSDLRDTSLEDFERSLSSKWEKQLKQVWKILKKLNLKFDYIICSTSKRAVLTYEWLMKEYDKMKKIPTIFAHEIYDFHEWWTKEIIDIIKKLEDNIDSFVIIWHNPLFEELVKKLTTVSGFSIPTLWIVQIHFKIDSWEDILEKGEIKLFISPMK